MKKIALIMAVIMVCTGVLAACGSTQEPEKKTEAETIAATEAETEEAIPDDGPMGGGTVAGGWTLNENESSGALSAEDKEVFEKATDGLAGMGYTPIACIGTQVVAGTNHLFLCQGTMVTAQPVTSLYAVVVYEDLQGNCEILRTKETPIDMMDLYAANQTQESGPMAGGFMATEDYSVVNLPAEAQDAFEKSMKTYDETFEPVALLGTQVVAGIRYAILCHCDQGYAVVYSTALVDGSEEPASVCVLDVAKLAEDSEQ